MARRSLTASCDRIGDLAQNLALLLEDAVDAGSRHSGDGLVTVGRGKWFTDVRPTETAARDPRRS